MADNYTRGSETFRSIDNSGIELPVIGVVPGGLPIVVSGAQYNQTVTSSVFTMTVPSGATHAVVSVRGDAVHFTEDGSSPSATAGIYLPNGFLGELAIPAALKFHRVTTDATIAMTYRRYA